VRTADDDPREVKRARERAAPFSQRESRQRQRGKRGRDGASVEDGGKKIKSMLKNILKEGKI